MNCSQTEILIHALLDNELATSHAIDVEAHLRTCAACSEELAAFEITRKVVVQADLMEFAPVPLRERMASPQAALSVVTAEAPDLREQAWLALESGAPGHGNAVDLTGEEPPARLSG